MPAMVDYEVQGRVALITLNRPEARNAVNGAVATEMEAAVDRMEDDPEIWVGVLRANTEGQDRPVFCAGADLKAINSGEGGALSTARGGFAGFAYRARRKPVIAAVDGLATAGGCEIVLACDLVVATTRSSFGLAEAKRNLIAGAGGLFRLPKATGAPPWRPSSPVVIFAERFINSAFNRPRRAGAASRSYGDGGVCARPRRSPCAVRSCWRRSTPTRTP